MSAGLEAGRTVSHYRILALLGAGGMGEVYLAADQTLERQVALKILPEALVRDSGRLQRFIQEAKAASSLNHPNIVTIYEIGTAQDGNAPIHYIAMELIKGKTLRETISMRPNIKKILELIIEVANGLAKAHTAGIVHRDLKPENIMVSEEGHAKLVDFGLAKLLPQTPQSGETDTAVMQQTREGTVMGTVGYMSPEQVEGRAADHRSDIFSLGCVLYEAVTGARAFNATAIVDALHQILHSEPRPIVEINPAAPADLQRVTERCLAKDPDERFQSVKEVSIELRRIVRAPERGPEIAKEGREVRPSRKRATTIGVAVVIALVAGAAAGLLFSRRQRNDRLADLSSYRFTPIETTPAYEGFPAWSPDGKTIAFVAEVESILQVFTRSPDSARRTQITRLTRDGREPFWSPDGSRIYFISLAQDSDGLWSVGAAGGSPQLVLPNVRTAAISPDGKMLALLRWEEAQAEGPLTLWFFKASGADAKKYEHRAFGDKYMFDGLLRYSPDGSKLGVWLQTLEVLSREFWEISLPGMVPTQRLASLSEVPRVHPFSWMADSRHIIFGADQARMPGFHLWMADTATNRFWPITATSGNEYYPTVSPDGKQIIFSSEESDMDLVEIPLDRSPVRSVLATSRVEKFPVWSPDGTQYAFVTDRSGSEEVWLRSASGAWERPVATAKDFPDQSMFLIAGPSFSPDGQRIAYQRSAGLFQIWISNIAGGPPVPLNRRPYSFEDHPSWSPDGNWVSFTSFALTGEGGQGSRGLPSLQKVRVGADEAAIPLHEGILMSGGYKWSPTGEWITCGTVEGVLLVSPEGNKSRVISEGTWFVHEWSGDGKTIYAIRSDEELHLILTKVDVATGEETILSDLGPSPPTNNPFLGLSLAADGKSLLTSVPRLRGDLWLLEGFETTDRWGGWFSRK